MLLPRWVELSLGGIFTLFGVTMLLPAEYPREVAWHLMGFSYLAFAALMFIGKRRMKG